MRREIVLASLAVGTAIVLPPASAAWAADSMWVNGSTQPAERADMPEILHNLRIHASPDRVYQAIATAEGIRHWWTRDATLDPKVGGSGEFGFFARRFVAQVKIDELKPPSHMTWQVTNRAWPGKTIDFTLRAEGADTRVLFAHRGFEQADERYASAATRWAYYLISLKGYLETGTGTPNPDDADL
jgi:uncharacterized protein YndB with AHSA1/START domain